MAEQPAQVGLMRLQRERDALRAERDGLLELVSDVGDWVVKFGRLENHGHRKDTDGSCSECNMLNRLLRAGEQSHASTSPERLGVAVSREELVEALRLPGAHGPVEYALNRVATALERGGKVDG